MAHPRVIMPTFRSPVSNSFLSEFKVNTISAATSALNVCILKGISHVAEGLNLTLQSLEKFTKNAIELDLIRLDLGSVEQGKTFNFLGRNVYILLQNLLLISNFGGSK